MQFRTIPGTDVQVSEFAFGSGDNAGGLIYADTAQQIRLVEAALASGINYFDCSPDYGKGLAEANLGRILRDMKVQDEVFLVTKVEIMPEDFPRIPEKVEQSISDSLLRLRRDHVDLVMLHNPCQPRNDTRLRTWTPLTPEQFLHEVLPALQKARAAGKTRLLGVAEERADGSCVEQVLASRQFSLMNVWFNLANPSAVRPVEGLPGNEQYFGFFDSAQRYDVGVAVIRPLAGGALTKAIGDLGADGRHPVSGGWYRQHPEELEPERARGRRFGFLERASQTLVEAAYKYILSFHQVTSIIGGFSEVAHISDALAASDGPPLSPGDLAEIAGVHDAGFVMAGQDE